MQSLCHRPCLHINICSVTMAGSEIRSSNSKENLSMGISYHKRSFFSLQLYCYRCAREKLVRRLRYVPDPPPKSRQLIRGSARSGTTARCCYCRCILICTAAVGAIWRYRTRTGSDQGGYKIATPMKKLAFLLLPNLLPKPPLAHPSPSHDHDPNPIVHECGACRQTQDRKSVVFVYMTNM